MSLLDEAKELIEMSLNNEVEKVEYDRQARLWLEKTTEMMKSHAEHHKHHEEGASCSLCGFDLACPSCGH
jgi:CRISPR/Cas system-associated exonuclease Cas4 (RecB family)